jgi:TIR domain
MTTPPLKAFISYKWEDDDHNDWVKRFASDLRAYGIDAILDRWEVRLGDSFTDFMTSKIAQADAVLFIMTTRSVAAAETPKGKGGAVKFEIQMATSRRIAGEKLRLIGVYRKGNKPVAHLRDNRYADFRDDSKYEERLKELVDDLLGINLKPHLKTSRVVRKIRPKTSKGVQARISLYSGCFLPGDEENYATEIGYFQSSKDTGDIRVSADGHERWFDEMKSLGKRCEIEIRHVKADGTIYNNGARASATFHEGILHLKDLYGRKVGIDRRKFDCIIRFESGFLSSMLIQPVAFKEVYRMRDGSFSTHATRRVRPCAHIIVVQYALKGREALEIVRDGEVLWSNRLVGAKSNIDVEFTTDSTTLEKYYRHVLKPSDNKSYWIPASGSALPYCIGDASLEG